MRDHTISALHYPFCALALGLILASGCSPHTIAGGPIPPQRLVDGTYRGSASEGPVKVIVEVTVQGRAISHIALIKHRHLRGGAAEGVVPRRIIEQQSTRVDAVSGATLSSRTIMNAVQDAVDKAVP